jgi:hypothetical protein
MKPTFHLRELKLSPLERARVGSLLRGRHGTEAGHISIYIKDKNGVETLVQAMTYHSERAIEILETSSPNKLNDKPARKYEAFYHKISARIKSLKDVTI